MSTVMDKLTSRQPLKDSSNYKNNSEMTPSKSRSQLSVALPITQNTPPESISAIRRPETNLFETPTRLYNIDTTSLVGESQHLIMQSSYLSPAFSSPTQKHTQEQNSEKLTSSPIRKSLETKKSKSKAKSNTSPANTGRSFNLQSEDKPPYSYATLIGISILSHPEKKLTLSHIYQWISDTFKYYKKGDVGWQNSIRHNLSLNKAFIKGEKSKDGKGHFWCIKPGCEEQFLKSRSVKKSSYQEVMDQINHASKINAEAAARAAEEKAAKEATESKLNSNYGRTNLASSPNYPKSKRKLECDDEDDDFEYDEEDVTVIDPPMKKQKVATLGEPWQSSPPIKSTSSNDTSDTVNVAASSSESKVNAVITTTPKTTSTPRFVIDSPNRPILAGKNLTYTSSFSCSSNFELSPVRPLETGPLLEPLTPANNIYRTFQTQQQQSLSSSHVILRSRTPKSTIVKTPIRNIRTPQTSSIVRKLWNSPSYLDDFYYSPLINNSINLLAVSSNSKLSTIQGSFSSYDDDDMVSRNFENPHVHSSPILGVSSDRVIVVDDKEERKNLLQDLKNVENSSKSKS
ncbi:forkhead transcription factor, putative [Candida dubliniensis CD36]|uniref:Forkhead transcription factor, putative n=1 Tax=Candida dubliniensis (strain CD36 / ATCC MYA-646 / CBS 7987 / NCPF 3949 / NRRL Y-17841) TaxID=573826 RepID=B9W903_CANDC|nr:forkhead transcription factor, putative [Candida dubliniensis CD36]CAX45228.1 forkhead transcription factor, putative [Candida dubliniensis CD36]